MVESEMMGRRREGMRNSERLSITVRRLASAGQEYTPTFHSDLYGVTFCVSFPDMTRGSYGREVILELTDKPVSVNSRPLLEMPADGRLQVLAGGRMKRQ